MIKYGNMVLVEIYIMQLQGEMPMFIQNFYFLGFVYSDLHEKEIGVS